MLTMNMVIIVLLSLSIILLILSFFKRDKISELEQQVEQLTMTMMQENYQLKKRMKILEEELLGGEELNIPPKPSQSYEQSSDSNKEAIMQLLQKNYTDTEMSEESISDLEGR